jgi:WD40 repeat protein
MGVAYVDGRTIVSTGENTSDGAWDDGTSALKVWDLGAVGGAEASAPGGVTGMDVDDHGVATVRTPGGVRTLYAGEDGRLHATRTLSGPASEPAAPALYAGLERKPRWGDGGSGGSAAISRGAAADGPNQTPGALATTSRGNGKLVAGADGKLELWGPPAAGGGAEATTSFVRLRTFEGHKAPVIAAAVSPQGRYIVSADQLGTVRLWDLMRPARCRELEQQMAQAHDLIETDPASPAARATLRAWYAFRGHDVTMAYLVDRGKLVQRLNTDAGESK